MLPQMVSLVIILVFFKQYSSIVQDVNSPSRVPCWKLFQQVRAGLPTKAKLWESLRSLLKVLVFRTMTALYRQMAYQYDIQLK
jgi:hypothetical protein